MMWLLLAPAIGLIVTTLLLWSEKFSDWGDESGQE